LTGTNHERLFETNQTDKGKNTAQSLVYELSALLVM